MTPEPGRQHGPRAGTLPARLAPDEGDRGATATEYAILVGFIAVAIALSIGLFGSSLAQYFDNIASAVGAALS